MILREVSLTKFIVIVNKVLSMITSTASKLKKKDGSVIEDPIAVATGVLDDIPASFGIIIDFPLDQIKLADALNPEEYKSDSES